MILRRIDNSDTLVGGSRGHGFGVGVKSKSVKLFGNAAVMLLIVLVLAGSVGALGITPGRTTFDFVPGKSESVNFEVLNSEGDSSFVVFAKGEFENNILLSDVAFDISAGEGSKSVSYTLNMPEILSPGTHKTDIVVTRLPKKSGNSDAYVGATVAVVTEVVVNVPIPGKYAEAELNIMAPDAEGKMNFVIPVWSRGEFDLVDVRATVELYSSLNEKVGEIFSNRIAIPSGQRKELIATWDAKVASGPYRAVASVLYDEQTLSLEREFSVGSKKLKLENVEVNDFKLGEIAKFEILVSNEWTDVVEGVFAEMEVYNEDGAVSANFKSPTYDISSQQKELMLAFWDTKGVKKGTYDSTLFLKYGKSVEQQNLKLEVDDNAINIVGFGYVISRVSGENGNLVMILIGVIVLLVVANLSWFIFLRKKLMKK